MKFLFSYLHIFAAVSLIGFFQIQSCRAQVIPLWEQGAPGFENRKDEPESAKDWWVKNIHNPNLTVFKPDNPNGAAILVLPGGGHRALVYNSEGKRAANFLTNWGFTVFVLKYRLVREDGSDYTFEHVRQDARRGIRMVRQQAGTFGFNPNRVGVMGFSAGGEVASMLAFEEEDTKSNSDAIDGLSFRPDFLVQVYPGPLFIPGVSVPEDAPPAFLVASNNDECCSETIIQIMRLYRDANVPVEMHLYGKGDHAFNMGTRSELVSLKGWPNRLREWFEDFRYFPAR